MLGKTTTEVQKCYIRSSHHMGLHLISLDVPIDHLANVVSAGSPVKLVFFLSMLYSLAAIFIYH